MKINVKSKEMVEKSISNVQKKCKVRILNAQKIEKATVCAEKKMESLGIPKKHRTGVVVTIIPPKVPNRYFGVPRGTTATIYRGSSEWFLTRVVRAPSGKKPYGSDWTFKMELPDITINTMPRCYNI